MSVDSSAGYDMKAVSNNYIKYRPIWPKQLYDKIFSYIERGSPADGRRGLVVDVGCGSGQSTLPLCKYFNSVVGIDSSEAQLAEAKQLCADHKNAVFKLLPAEKLSSVFEDESVDLITVGCALHWFDINTFFTESLRILKPGGTLAVFTGQLPIYDKEEVHDIIHNQPKTHQQSLLTMTAEYISIFFIIFVVSFLFLSKWNGKKNPSRQLPPSLPSLPLIGSLPFLRKFDNNTEFFMEKSHQLGPLFVFRMGNRLVLTLNNKEIIEEAFVKNSRSFSSRPEMFMQKLINPNRKGIGVMDTTPEWKRLHQLSLSILKEFGFGDKSIMEERILTEVEEMIDFTKKKGETSFDPKEMALLMTSNVIMNIMFGSRRSFYLGLSKLIQATDDLTHSFTIVFDAAPFLRFIPGFREKIFAAKNCSKRLHDIVELEIERSLQIQYSCFLSEYIKKEGPNYDRDQLKFLLRDMIGAGTETTSNTFLWSLVALANYPEIQNRLQKDIDSVIPRDRLPMLMDRTKLPFVEATILELYRWRTLVPLSIAHNVKHDSILRNYFVPAGTLVLPNLYAAHSDPKVWKDPDVFKPERFLDQEGNVIGKDRIIPFSLGRRSCLGEILAQAEIFLILTSLIQRFTVLPPDGQDKICEKPLLPIGLIASPKAFNIRLSDRR